MDLEIQQVEQIEELTREFINVMKELNLLSSETIQRLYVLHRAECHDDDALTHLSYCSFGGQLRPLIQEAKQAVDGCLERELERYAAAVTEEQLAAWTEDQQRLLDDKEALHTGLGSSHEQRNTKIDLIVRPLSYSDHCDGSVNTSLFRACTGGCHQQAGERAA